MERCHEHVVVDGQVDRSAKVNSVVERVRRCKDCGCLFKTFEMTEDQQARIRGEHDLEIMDLKEELDYYRKVVEDVKTLYMAERLVREDLKSEYEVGSEDRD